MGLPTLLRSIIVLFSLMLLGNAALAETRPAVAETRVALVIGAGHYRGANTLKNPINDAQLVSAALKRSGFKVTQVLDPDLAIFNKNLAAFRQDAATADVALVYYAGHGVEVNGANWLLPVSVVGRNAGDLTSEAVRASAIIDAVGPAKKVRLVILDACRDDPYAVSGDVAAVRHPASNVVVLMAAQPGGSVTDGRGTSTSPFAAAFASLIREPGLRLGTLPTRIAQDVKARLGRDQRPDQQGIFDAPDWTFVPSVVTAQAIEAPATPGASTYHNPGSRNEVMRQFVPVQPTAPKPKPAPAPKPTPAAPKPAPVAPVPYDFERGAWDLCAKSKSTSPCEAYLAKYPNGKWADLAATRIKDMNAQPVAASKAAPVQIAPVEDKERTDWLLCQSSTAPGQCERYLETYPTGRWADQAKTRARAFATAAQDKLVAAQEKADWDACQSGASPGACEKYIATYPSNPRAGVARDRINKARSEGEESTAWGLCQNSNAAGACEKYLATYPASPRAGQARDMVNKFRADGEEKSAWAACQNGDSALPCEKYLTGFRAGPNAGAASSLIAKFAKADQDRLKVEQEKTAWSLCEGGKTALPCNDYLRVFADGRFADSARTRIRVLETAATEPEMVPALGLVVRRNDKGEMVVVSVQQYSSAMGNVFGGDVIVKINDQPTKPSDAPRQTIEAALAAASGRVKLLIRRGPAAVTAVIRARP